MYFVSSLSIQYSPSKLTNIKTNIHLYNTVNWKLLTNDCDTNSETIYNIKGTAR